ncbi:glycoside hydrolase family 73 protein [Schleiferilactobacillus perolens]|jgi:flagellum-specific peptidoglycan hydrolase FlgJ|uniref:glycoside hydrolase family 73 protein n=1 Tax=Schleiferilactobacillus perolens TaxID=100468 RepID=UPI0023572B4D|nr:glycoside hydrolase family 73 protein [Schleiferilactobacillus perolens]MCI2172591.1 glycoside hydrolase family 73 protein [Schleiferilactobacillus perolens]
MKNQNRWRAITLTSVLALTIAAPVFSTTTAHAATGDPTIKAVKAMDAVATPQQESFVSLAAAAAHPIATQYNLYTSVMIAQAILESAYGTSTLSLPPNNNLFGIKGTYNGQYVEMPTQEWDADQGKYVTVMAHFRKYPDYLSSFNDNGQKLRYGVSWDANYYSGAWVENTTSYQDATKALTGKYATSPTYGDSLNSLIQRWDLTQYDATLQNQRQTIYVTNQSGAPIYNGYSDESTATGATLPYGSGWITPRQAVLLNKTVYYQVATNQWVSSADVSLQNPTTITKPDDTTSVLYINTADNAPIYNTYLTNRTPTGRTLKPASAWRVTRIAKLANGETMYEIGTNNWLKSSDITFSMPGTDTAAPIESPTNDVYTVTAANGATISGTNRKLPHGSRWKINKMIFQANGTAVYQVATNQWVYDYDGRLDSGETSSKVSGIIRANNKNGAPVLSTNLMPSGRILPNGSRWRFTAKKHTRGVDLYQVSPNEWVPGFYVNVE